MRFFFYGTLQAGNLNPAIAAIHGRLVPQGPGRITGALVAVPDADGWLPALVPGDGEVYGQVYAAGPEFSAEDLAALDRYEEFDPASPETSWYLRETRTLTSGELVTVYRMNGAPPADALPIPGGDFRAWLKTQNLPEFQGRDSA
ncbi:gamma-glutamylcyclotransferase family protein [Novosphingobium ginsenosidimutans]|uniref:Gamma-glutamylcyclotransferase n=1 Tax=Novosphingobium ginsenosidimutans TaxID=1176536 RepID=A0A5B8S255_9SPHN|nr:gamma-glutamylcyclotransferase family protein [Novosphingobium ginsenosidimutans]QEA15208.1 gamma-glutamylcyclotransferase [Novosphingobium ginsenosidimutans]